MGAVDPASLPRLAINFECGDTEAPGCTTRARSLYERFVAPSTSYPGYGTYAVNASILVIPDDIEADWFGKPESYWMRQKIRRAVKLGYEVRDVERNDYLDDIYAINTSLEERQGRPMTDAYQAKPQPQSPLGEQPCPRHQLRFLGVLLGEQLVAYTSMQQYGEFVLISTILGHGEHMKDGIMQLLVYEGVRAVKASGHPAYAMYNLHDSGTEGLQFFKRKMGFEGYLVDWQP